MEGSKGYVESILCTALINVSIREEKLGRGRQKFNPPETLGNSYSWT
jgi:hypothetical protein